MANTENDIEKALKNIKRIETREKEREKIIFKYLNENRFFEEKALFINLNYLIKEEVDEKLENKKEQLKSQNKSAEDIKAILKYERKNFFIEIKNVVKSHVLPRILRRNRILLEPFIASSKIVILREKEAEFFVFIFSMYKNDSDRLILRAAIEEGKNFLDIQSELEKLIEDKILLIYGENMVSNINCNDRKETYHNKMIENIIFNYIISIGMNRKIEKTNNIIKKTENKIKDFNKKIEKNKIDIITLLGIFVAIISIIYANISASISNELSSVVVTNISTITCIFFLLAYIEIFIKDKKNKDIIKYFGCGFVFIVALVLIIGFYIFMKYEKNNFIKYMENIYELKNKETTLELQHFTIPSDY